MSEHKRIDAYRPENSDTPPGNAPDQGSGLISDPMVSVIERYLFDPDASLEKLEKMLDMKTRLEDRAREEVEREQKQAYHRAMAACQAELKVVVKNRENTHTKSTYADLAALAEQVDPVIHKHGFSLSFQPAGWSERGDQRIKWTIAHEGGHVESDIADIPVDKAGSQGKVNKTDTQAFGSTASYGRRYLKLMLFDIATGDDTDGNPSHGGPVNQDQLDRLIALADEVDANKGDFCRYMSRKLGIEVGGLAEIPASAFDRAMNALEAKRKKTEQADAGD